MKQLIIHVVSCKRKKNRNQMKIRKVNLKDIEKLREIGKLTFAQTFSSSSNEENMTKYLKNGFSIRKLKTELTDINSEIYFAELDGKVIGYLKVNVGKSQTEIKIKNALEIERIYVLTEFHGKKIGQILYNKALELAKDKNVENIWLGVWEQNPRAIRFYEKNGFVTFDKHVFKLGNDEQTDLMMKLELNKKKPAANTVHN
jgi:ribosomal protein S18 acetylase RimI-like enzyme